MHFIQLTKNHVFNSLSSWRWWLVAPVFFVASLTKASVIRFDYVYMTPRDANVLDLFPALLSDIFYVSWIFVLGFSLLVGDDIIREVRTGIAGILLLRSNSRLKWWGAKIVATGILALIYIGLGTVGTLISGIVAGLPLSFSDSVFSLQDAQIAGGFGVYYRALSIPMFPFVILISLYTAFTLWIVGILIVSMGFLLGNELFVILIIGLWLGLSFSTIIPNNSLIDVRLFVSYIKHLQPALAISYPDFFALAFALLLGSSMLVSLRLRTLDF